MGCNTKNLILRILILIVSITLSQHILCQEINEEADTLRGVTLKEVTIKRQKEHYSKRNNPAVEFIKKLRNNSIARNPRNFPYYSYKKYEKFSLGLHDFQVPDTSSNSRFGFLRQHTDTSDISGVPILPLSVKEKSAKVYYRHNPASEREVLMGARQEGIDEIINLDNIQTMISDIFREINLYDDDITLLRNRFVSPLSKIGPDFYRYYLLDTITINSTRYSELAFAPRNPQTFGFLGRVWIEEQDTTLLIRKVKMSVSPAINLNYVSQLSINQSFDMGANGAWLKNEDDLNIIFTIIKGSQPIYARRTTLYSDHTFPDDTQSISEIFKKTNDELIDSTAFSQDSIFWDQQRKVHVSQNEQNLHLLLQRLRNVPIYKYGEKFIRLMVNGYVPTGKNSKFDFGPLNTFIGGNTVEGFRLSVGGMTTAALNRHLFARCNIAYGFHDRKVKYNGEVEYSFKPKKLHSREFPIHSIAISEKYDIDQLGQNYAFTNPNNMFLAIKRMPNRLVTYLRSTQLTYTIENQHHLRIKTNLSYNTQHEGPFVKFITPRQQSFHHFNECLLKLEARYAPGEKFYQGRSQRISINLDFPEITFTQTLGVRNLLNTFSNVNISELTLRKRFWLSAFGYTDIYLKGGIIWGKTIFTHLFSPNANLSYTIQPESFALANPMEFLADKYFTWDITYWGNGIVFNNIPLLKKLKLREAVSFKGWYGTLNQKSNPANNLSDHLFLFPAGSEAANMLNTPYMELSAGLDNLFKIIRLDYVWRLTYRNKPNIDRSGVRIALHFTF